MRKATSSIAIAIYLVIGLFVIRGHHYYQFAHINHPKGIASLVLAVIAWPLVLFGVSFHIR
jgi:hypothetical protein